MHAHFDNQQKVPGGKKAFLAPGCRDQGIVILIRPAGHVNGRLVLTARKAQKRARRATRWHLEKRSRKAKA
jgi:hypothetical protein